MDRAILHKDVELEPLYIHTEECVIHLSNLQAVVAFDGIDPHGLVLVRVCDIMTVPFYPEVGEFSFDVQGGVWHNYISESGTELPNGIRRRLRRHINGMIASGLIAVVVRTELCSVGHNGLV